MKKVLSLVLALVLALGMATVAFAALGDVSASETIGTPLVLSHVQGDSDTLTIALGAAIVEDALGTGFAPDGTPVNGTVSAPAGITVTSAVSASSGQEIEVAYTVAANATVRNAQAGNISITRAGVVVTQPIVLTVTASAPALPTMMPAGAKITDIATGRQVIFTPDPVGLEADDDAVYQLTPADFIWSGLPTGLTGANYADGALRASHLTAANIKLRVNQKKGFAGVIDDIYIDGTEICFDMVKFYNKTGDTDWSFEISFGKGNNYSAAVAYAGTMSNERIWIYEGDTDVDIDGNYYARAYETVRGCEFEVGENVFVTKNLSKDQKIYCRATLDLSSADSDLFLKYAELDSVYTMISTNVAGAGTTVRFDLSDTFYVYDEGFKLIGTTSDAKLPWSPKYYLTTKKVDMGGTAVVDPGDGEDPSVDPDPPVVSGGDAVTTPNNNYNPNTGL